MCVCDAIPSVCVCDAIPSVCVWGGVGRAIRSVMGLSIVFQMSI